MLRMAACSFPHLIRKRLQRQRGNFSTILVRAHRTKEGEWEIVAGERRWRAAQKARLHEVPIVVRDLSDRDTLEIALSAKLMRRSAVGRRRGRRRS